MKNLILKKFDNAKDRKNNIAISVSFDQEEIAKELSERLIAKKLNKVGWIKSIRTSHNFVRRTVTVIHDNGIIEEFSYDYKV